MPRKGENIYKRKDGRWEGRYIRSYDSEHKAKYAYVYGKTYSEVKRKLTEQRGNVQKVQPTKNKSSTYGELLDCWLHSMQLNTKESTQSSVGKYAVQQLSDGRRIYHVPCCAWKYPGTRNKRLFNRQHPASCQPLQTHFCFHVPLWWSTRTAHVFRSARLLL